jgi:hypothetical protein
VDVRRRRQAEAIGGPRLRSSGGGTGGGCGPVEAACVILVSGGGPDLFRWELQDSVVGMGTGFGEDSNFEEEQTQCILC